MNGEDKRRYLVVVSVFMEVILPLFRRKIAEDYTPRFTSLQNFLNDNEILHKLFHLRFRIGPCCKDDKNCKNHTSLPLTHVQWNILYTAILNLGHCCHCIYTANAVTTDQLDVTLASLILLNCCNITPQIQRAIEQLRTFKNQYLSHNTTGRVSESDFNNLWTELETCVLQLDTGKQDDLIRIKIRPLDEDLCNKYATCLLHIHEKIEQIEAKLDAFRTEIGQKVNEIPKNAICGYKQSFGKGQVNHNALGKQMFTYQNQIDLSEVGNDVLKDMVMMDDGRLVMCASWLRRLLICDTKGKVVDKIILQDIPWNLTAVDNHTVAVTLIEKENLIEMYDINTKASLRSFKVPEEEIWGITTINNKLLVSVTNKLLVIDHQTKQIVQTIHTEREPKRLHTAGDHIYFSFDNTLNCYSITGDKLFTTKFRGHVHSTTTLHDGSLYVVCNDGSVKHVSSDGQKYKTVKTKNLKGIKLVYFNEKNGTLLTKFPKKSIFSVFHESGKGEQKKE